MKEKIKEFFLSDWTLSEKVLLITDVLLLGVVIGWITSPRRKEICRTLPSMDGTVCGVSEANCDEES